MYSYQPNFTILTSGHSNIPVVDECLDRPNKAWTNAEAALWWSKEEMARDGKSLQEFKVGDKVWLDTDKVQVYQASQKLGPKQLSPYEIIEKLGDRDY